MIFSNFVSIKTLITKYILKRKRIYFHCLGRDQEDLTTILTNLRQCILSEVKLSAVKQQATKIIEAIGRNISESFTHKKVHHILTGGTAERFGVPLSSKWINVTDDINEGNALISDFKYVTNRWSICIVDRGRRIIDA